ncbi:unnamed protein product [Caenorhabditis brenneri]
MNKLWVVLIFTLIPITTANRRSVDAWPKEFDEKKLANWEQMRKYFTIVPNSTSDEWHFRVPIQRRYYATVYKNGTEQRDGNALYTPIHVFISDSTRLARWFGIAHMVFFFLLTGSVTVVCIYFGLGKLSTHVYVRNLYDENKPIREMWCAVTFQFRGKKHGKTPIQTQPFERRIDEGEKASKQEKK